MIAQISKTSCSFGFPNVDSLSLENRNSQSVKVDLVNDLNSNMEILQIGKRKVARVSDCSNSLQIELQSESLNSSQLKMVMSFFNYLKGLAQVGKNITVRWSIHDQDLDLMNFFLSEVKEHYCLEIGLECR